MVNYHHYLNEDSTEILIPKELALILISFYQKWIDDGEGFHRTPVSEFEGDVLDNVEVEMINDQIISKVEEDFNEANKEAIDLLLEILSSGEDLTAVKTNDSEKISQLLMISNTAYTQLSKDKISDFKIGTAQGDEVFESTIDLEENPRELIRFLLMAFIEELVEVWS